MHITAPPIAWWKMFLCSHCPRSTLDYCPSGFFSRVHVTPLHKLWEGTLPTPQPCCSVLLTCSGTSSESTFLVKWITSYFSQSLSAVHCTCQAVLYATASYFLSATVLCSSLEYHSQMVSDAVKRVIKQGKVSVHYLFLLCFIVHDIRWFCTTELFTRSFTFLAFQDCRNYYSSSNFFYNLNLAPISE